jgi:hypothetical protein
MSSATWSRSTIEIMVKCEMARAEIALGVAELLDVPLFEDRPYDWVRDGDGHG